MASSTNMTTDKLAKIMKALSSPQRLKLYLEIVKRQETSFETGCCECFVTDIVASLSIGAPTVSHHLKELANAGLISTEKRGKYLVARVNEKTIGEVSSVLSLHRTER